MRPVLGHVKQAFNYLTERYLDHRFERTAGIPSEQRLVRQLASANLVPKTVIDVGVAEGTPWLYENYPEAKFFLFDPTPQSLPHMRAWSKHLNADIFNIGLSDHDGLASLDVRPQQPSDSSLFRQLDSTMSPHVIEVDVRRFDTINLKFARPALMKIDVQGAELMVLKGMGDRIGAIDCFVIETNLIATLQDIPEFEEISHFLGSKGFSLFDIVSLIRRPLDGAASQIDAVFVPSDSALRSDRRWSVTSPQ
jgi:FkbM family methyltransferase